MSDNKIRIIAVCVAVVCLVGSIIGNAQHKSAGSVGFEMSDSAIDLEALSARHISSALEVQSVGNRLTTDGFVKKIDNGTLQVWFREEIAAIRIVDGKTGYVWGALDSDKPENMSKIWSAFANSVCTLEYYNKKDVVKQLPLSDSALNTKFTWSTDGLKCVATAKKLGLRFAFDMKVKGNAVTFTLDESKFKEDKDKENRIKSVYFLPFIGSTVEDKVPGYVLLPDGSGALMRFAKKFSYTSGFDKKIYGADVATDNVSEQKDLGANRNNDYMVEAPQVTLPLFGIVHGNGSNAILSVCENGEEYASIVANPSGYITDYNWAAMRFDYRCMYVYKAVQEGEGINTVKETMNEVNLKQTFYFLNGSDATYSGMAVYYRELLKKDNVFSAPEKKNEIPLGLTLIGADVKDGFFFDTLKVLTTIKQAEEITDAVRKQVGVNNLTLSFKGWKDGGLNRAGYNNLKITSKLGNKSDLFALKEKIEKQGGTFYLEANAVMGNKDQINVSQEAALDLSKQSAVYENANQELMYWQDYVIRPSVAEKFIKSFYKTYEGYSVSLPDLGYRLYSDNTRDNEKTRTETKELFKKLASEKGDRKLAMSSVNGYLYSAVDDYFDIPTVSSQYIFESDSVPFLQIVLKGNVNYYGPYVNQGFYSRSSVLKLIEYGMYPSFVCIGEENSALTYTPLESYFSIHYKDWLDTMKSVYSEVNEALIKVEGSEISAHTPIASGVVRVDYKNGVSLYINYSSKEYTSGGITVPSLGWKAVGE